MGQETTMFQMWTGWSLKRDCKEATKGNNFKNPGRIETLQVKLN